MAKKKEDALGLAIQALVEQRPFQVLMAYVYQSSNMAGNPFTTNALTTAHNTGKMLMGQELFALIANKAPHFYPSLMKEILTDATRTLHPDVFERGDASDDPDLNPGIGADDE